MMREKRLVCSSFGGGGGGCSECEPRWLELDILISLGTKRRELVLLVCCMKLDGTLCLGYCAKLAYCDVGTETTSFGAAV